MTRTGYAWRFALAVSIDLLDATVGRGLFVLPWEEGIATLALIPLWGWTSLFYLWELADITEQFDGFAPTATLIGLVHFVKARGRFGPR